MDGGGGGNSGSQTTTNELPEWAKPYAKSTLEKGAALSETPYQKYDQARIAGFSPMQLQSQQNAANMQTSGATGAGINAASLATLGALGTNYQGGGYGNQFQAPDVYQPGQFNANQVQNQGLNQYQMRGPQQVRSQDFGNQSAQDYMSPYMQNVVDVQQREAQRTADIAGTSRNANAVRSGAFGGSRQAVMDAEAARNLATQKGDIQATGQQAAFTNAQQQFNADQARRMQAQQANQGAGLTAGQANLNALLGVQSLGAGQNLQSQLANQQYGLQAQQLGEQSRQFGAGQGLTAAQAAAQYGQAANQLNEQSNQYGAGLGMQGLQTALQGAGQLGTLGGQQFQQGMDINKLQNAYGGQQQALRQQGLDQAYTDFQNEQNYPYKQLGFMSDLVRGLPLGTQSTQQMYQAPGSIAGQLGGLGLGVYGLSKFQAEGGLTSSYADGGVTRALNDDGALAAAMDKLTDEQLQQILQQPTTKAQLEAAQEEMAMRASERGGMASAYNQLAPQQQQGVVTAAGGGILAFSKGGDEGEYFQDPMGAPSYEVKTNPFKQNVREGETYTPGLLGMMFGYNRLPKEEKVAETKAPADTEKFDRSTATRREDYMPKTKAAAPAGGLTAAVKQMAASTGAPEDDFLTTFRKLRTELQSEGKEDMKALNDQIAKLGGRSQEIRDKGLGKALAEFGFNWAAKAAEPGARFTGSAAKAAPTLAASAAKTDELAQAADDNAMKMQLTMKQYEIAQRKGDTQAAAQMAQNMRMLQQTEKQIAMQREHYAAQAGLGQAQLAQKDKQFGELMGYRNKVADAQGLAAQARVVGERRKAMVDFDNANRRKEAELIQQYGPIQGKYQYNQLRNNYINDVLQTSRDQRGDMSSATGGGSAKSVFDLLDES
jgi:hypothetical protein